MINAALSGLKGLNLQIFIDDICIASDSWDEHLKIIDKVLDKLIEANLTLRGEKCIFGSDEIVFLGHLINKNGIQQDPNKNSAILSMSAPQDKNGIRRFLGMAGYYRKFVPGFAIISEPLTRLTRKSCYFNWGEEQESAFNKLKQELSKNAILAHYNHQDPLMLKTDASKAGIAGLLLQQQNGEWKIVTCCSRRLSTSEAIV